VGVFINAIKKITDGSIQERFCKWGFLLALIKENHRWHYTRDILQVIISISANTQITDGIIQETFCK